MDEAVQRSRWIVPLRVGSAFVVVCALYLAGTMLNPEVVPRFVFLPRPHPITYTDGPCTSTGEATTYHAEWKRGRIWWTPPTVYITAGNCVSAT